MRDSSESSVDGGGPGARTDAPEDWPELARIGRRRHRRFVAYLLEELAVGDGLDAAGIRAGRRMGWRTGFKTPMKDKALVHKTRVILENSDVAAAMRELFSETETFHPHHAASWLVRHIKGEVEEEKASVTKDGDVIKYTVKAKPSLAALQAYNALAFPKAAKQVNVDQRVLVAKALVSDEPPAMHVRSLEKPAPAIETIEGEHAD